MAEYKNSGILFKNFGKKQDNHPDYQGTASITDPATGVVTKWKMSAWIKPLKSGKGKFMSIYYKVDAPEVPAGMEREAAPATTPAEPQEKPPGDIPF